METGLLFLAYDLAMLSFFIGVLIYALPIPWYPLKRWAPRLMVDSIIAAILAISFYTLLDVSNFIARILGGSWELFYKWLKTSIGVMIGLKTLVFTIKALVSKFPILEALKSNLRPIDRVADAGIFVISWIWGLKLIIKDFGEVLAAIGVALISVPFRISRSAGAWLLSFVLVFNAGLQVLPVFLSTIAEAPGRPDPSELEENGLAFATIMIHDFTGKTLGGGILHMYNPSWKEWSRLHIDIVGEAVDDKYGSVIPVPSRTGVYYVLEVDGVYFPLSPYPFYPSDYSTGVGGVWEGNLSNPYIAWLGNYTIAYTNASLIRVDHTSPTETFFTIHVPGKSYFAVRLPVPCNSSINAPGGRFTEFAWSWKGIDGIAFKIIYNTSGYYNITLHRNNCIDPHPDLGSTFNYLDKVSKLGTFTDIDFIEAFLLYYLTVPFLYIFLLLSITAGLARLLGGRERLPIRI